mmetsp:Transcript_16615/g.52922  ORF Transcript_16615/g.52922 Transcript_16615/m.52922 type:complete len:212 (-) Transcript_16615:820-1455(-)
MAKWMARTATMMTTTLVTSRPMTSQRVSRSKNGRRSKRTKWTNSSSPTRWRPRWTSPRRSALAAIVGSSRSARVRGTRRSRSRASTHAFSSSATRPSCRTKSSTTARPSRRSGWRPLMLLTTPSRLPLARWTPTLMPARTLRRRGWSTPVSGSSSTSWASRVICSTACARTRSRLSSALSWSTRTRLVCSTATSARLPRTRGPSSPANRSS